jgi:formylglycine-generating enzyme required for sulfatase activity
MKTPQRLAGVAALVFLASGITLAQAPGKSLPEKMSVDLGGGVKMDFVLIHPGKFMMGSEKGLDNEKPAHEVTLTKPFYLGIYEVTQAQWKVLMGDDPAHFKGDDLPVETVRWDDCHRFLTKLKEKLPEGLTCRLPTEAEWEYACRAGSQTEYCCGDDVAALGEYAWYSANCENKTHPVGQKKPNAWGLYDMHGNVWEWCEDGFAPYTAAPATDPKGPLSTAFCVARGGAWQSFAERLRSSYRFRALASYQYALLGLRVAVLAPE